LKKIIIFLLFISISDGLFSQMQDISHYNNGFAINIESFLANDIKLTYSHKIKNKIYFESMLSYNIPIHNENGWGLNHMIMGSSNNEESMLDFRDPYYYYGRYQIRAGLKLYKTRRFYICPEFLYSYGSFNQRKSIFYQTNVNTYHEVNRIKNDYELLVKCGWTFQSQHFLSEIYSGWGIRFKTLNDEVYEDSNDHGQSYFPVTPYNKITSYVALEFHLGFQLGYCTYSKKTIE
jgi:hypothetical protein